MVSVSTGSQRTVPGRPRDPRVEGAVRVAVLDLLMTGGYEAVSFREVAQRAGVGQPTVYRRWTTKAELVEFAIFAVADWTPPSPSGNLEKDLRRLAAAVLDGLLAPAVHAALPGLLLAYHDDPDGHTRLRAWAETPVLEAFTAIVDAAELDGGLRRADVGHVFDGFLAALILSVLTRTPEVARRSVGHAARVADRALRGLMS
jgi:AcrR family transcriptional regulator